MYSTASMIGAVPSTVGVVPSYTVGYNAACILWCGMQNRVDVHGFRPVPPVLAFSCPFLPISAAGWPSRHFWPLSGHCGPVLSRAAHFPAVLSRVSTFVSFSVPSPPFLGVFVTLSALSWPGLSAFQPLLGGKREREVEFSHAMQHCWGLWGQRPCLPPPSLCNRLAWSDVCCLGTRCPTCSSAYPFPYLGLSTCTSQQAGTSRFFLAASLPP